MVTKPKQKPKPKPKQPAHSGAAIHTWIITAGVLTGILIATAALGFSYYSWNAGPPQTGKLSISATEKCRLEYRSGTEQHSAFAQSIPRIDLCWDLTINNIGPTRITLVEMIDQTKSFDSDIGGHVDLDYHAGLLYTTRDEDLPLPVSVDAGEVKIFRVRLSMTLPKMSVKSSLISILIAGQMATS